jgi:hypothetical protein
MKEELLHFIWKYRLIKPQELFTVSGNKVKIINPGELNTNAGPDFFNAKVQVGKVTLAGNIEIHIKSSDWLKHKHQEDKAYNSLILHVVYEHDKTINQNKEHNVETLELKKIIEPAIIKKYNTLISSKQSIPCSSQIKSVNTLKLNSWLDRMLAERVETKTHYIKQLFETAQRDYVQTFYLLLAGNFGFKVNAGPFELLAKNLPLPVLLKHKDNLFQLESLLFGMAGFLEQSYKDKYPQQLQNEFEFLKNKYKLNPVSKSLWKFLRLRPANFPTVRLSQFALIIHKSPELFSNPIKFKDADVLKKTICIEAQGYWLNHYKFEGSETKNSKILGEISVHNIIINTMAPYLFFYGQQTGNENYKEAALNSFEKLNFENNQKTMQFAKAGLKFKTGGQSQALINLYDNYCKKKNCIKCAVASNLLFGT